MRDIAYEISGLVPQSVTFAVGNELRITEDIDTEVDEASAKFGYYAILAEKAETKYQKLKFNFESWKALAESTTARERASEGVKGFTESQMKAHVGVLPKFRLYHAKLIETDEQRRILKVIAKAFEMKKDMVQTKSSNRRKEMNR